jgi:CheY-like chemotaxis protein
MPSENTEPLRAPANNPASKHVLVIEDFPVIAMSIEDELADMGYSSTVAASEAEALALAEQQCPDLIIADLRLAQGSGIEAVQRICRNRPIAVIFMSGDLEPAEGRVIGQSCFLSKPFTSAALKACILSAGPMSQDYTAND